MGIQINGQTDTVTSTTSGGSVTLTSATLPSVSNVSATRLNVTGVSTFTTGPVLIGSGTSTGTASQPLQVTGGAYVSGSLGIGTIDAKGTLHISGTTSITHALTSGEDALKGLVTIGTVGTSGGSLIVRTAGVNANEASGLGIDGTYSHPVSTINIKAFSANYAAYSSQIAFQTQSSSSSPTTRMLIDSSGRVTKPYQSMCYVVYIGTAIARGTRIPLVTTNGTYPGTNQGNHWSNSTNIFTCPVAGVYHASLNIFGNSTQSVQCLPTIRKNSATVAYSYYPGGGVSISILCAANDTIDFLYNHDNAGYNGADAAWASVYLLG